MKYLHKKTRNKIYRTALYNFTHNKIVNNLCYYLAEAIEKHYGTHSTVDYATVKELLPEFSRNKPKGEWVWYWWESDDHETRVKVLEDAIKDTC